MKAALSWLTSCIGTTRPRIRRMHTLWQRRTSSWPRMHTRLNCCTRHEFVDLRSGSFRGHRISLRGFRTLRQRSFSSQLNIRPYWSTKYCFRGEWCTDLSGFVTKTLIILKSLNNPTGPRAATTQNRMTGQLLDVGTHIGTWSSDGSREKSTHDSRCCWIIRDMRIFVATLCRAFLKHWTPAPRETWSCC